jgi:hypothetical protein
MLKMPSLPPIGGAMDDLVSHAAESTSDDAATFEAFRSASSSAPTTMPSYDYAKSAPISYLPASEAKVAIKNFENSIQSYYPPEKRSGVRDTNGNPESISRWDSRALSSMGQSRSSYDHAGDPAHVYNFDGTPVGILKMRHSAGESRIDSLTTHPGTSQVGETMIEHAVNESQKNNNGGVLGLYTTSASRGFYEKLGFTQVGGSMVLNPSKHPDIWTSNEDTQTWALKQLDGRGYLSKNPD